MLATNIIKLLAVALLTVLLSACGGGSSDVSPGQTLLTCDVPQVPDATGTMCVDPEPLQCKAPLVPDALNEECVVGFNENAPLPSVTPEANQAILYYNRGDVGAQNTPDDPSYEGYRLHTWNSDSCDAYAPPFDSSDWANGHIHDGVDPNYGAYWILNLKDGYSDCANFIIHIGTDDAGKALGSSDLQMPLNQDDERFVRMNFTFHGVPTVFEYPVESLGFSASGNSAHWIDANTIVWKGYNEGISSVKLHHSASAGIEQDDDGNITGSSLELTPVDLTDEQRALAPQVADWPAFQGDWQASDAKQVLKNQLLVVGYDGENKPALATGVQADKVLDVLYTQGDADADEAQLGVVYANGEVTVNLWAPTAQNVDLLVFDANKTETGRYSMTEDTATGIWSYTGDESLDRAFYQFEVTVYHYQTKAIEVLTVTDPYSVSLSTNGIYSQFVNLADEDLMPAGWDSHEIPTIANVEDAVIYEGHIRDFSARDNTVSLANRGKYKAFTEVDSAPVQHLQKLADSGLTHFHMLPANDIATVNEDAGSIVDITDTVADLCALNANAPVCGVEANDAVLADVLASYSPYTIDAAMLVDAMRNFDSFNWGYDPKHFNVPDGIYASNPDGVARIIEMREMIQALHNTGLRVVLDVVYNHTNSAGTYDNSVLDKVVPGYYHSRDIETGSVIQSTCCNDTALEHRMMDKLMVDSLVVWTEHYKFDGFRFDIMSHGSKAQMLAARDAIQAIDPDNYFYGEGWNRDDRGFAQANQFNMAGTEIATFNDRLREGIRTAEIFSNNTEENGPFIKQDIVKLGLAGSLADYVLVNYNGVASTGSAYSPNMYAKDPADNINYISKHDNESLWDQLQLELPAAYSMAERVRIQNVSHSIVLLSQGIPFLQLGGDFLRSKSLDRNTYDAGDWYNYVDFAMETNNFNVGLPLDKGGRDDDSLVSIASSALNQVGMSEMMFASSVFNEFLQVRTSSALFKLTSAEDIIDRIGFHNIGKGQTQGLIVMSIDDGLGLDDLDPAHDAIVVVINTSENDVSHTVATASGFSLHPVLAASVDSQVASASFTAGEGEGTFNVPAYTTAVFVKAQGESQGEGLLATATSGAPDVEPYGDTTVFVRGEMNGWGEVDSFSYQGQGVYRTTIALTAGTYGFKVASADWATVNLGAPAASNEVIVGEDFTLLPGSNDNLAMTIAEDATYVFTLDASDIENPVLHVRNQEAYAGTTIFVRGGMNGWSEDNPLEYIGDGRYSTTITVTAGSHEFKVASGDWSTVNLGAPSGDREVTVRDEKQLVPGSNDNLFMEFAAGDYTFILDTQDINAPTLTVYSAEMFGNTTVYIRGGMNGWGEVDALSYVGNSTYSVEIDLSAENHEFKVASGDWSTVNLGGDDGASAVSLDTPYRLTQGSNTNLTVDISEAATYVFTVVGPNPESPTVTITKK
ncbi:pullulanase-type alpha-1,6-glucosidase [Thalassotalea sp. LPB0316]|uniref:pullulanase-type alpha-1,6-glucosidase n=1 Tax=Thalassotalea sp. LPB0316 TaxID=2769490 RepID=UPI0018695D77|nr:pullulanase-type alpha-1,6-glucosidase [Thalassotalea sp. LPB0316]QOL26772.1 pullulanase-type alpha-1,6-glucosidase [Thalassotalea sp. LPB0316]